MKFNREKLAHLEALKTRRQAVSHQAGERYDKARLALQDARDEFERQRKARANAYMGGGVERMYERRVREAVEAFEKVGAEVEAAKRQSVAAGALVDACHRYLQEHGIDLRAEREAEKVGDGEIMYSEAESATHKRRRPSAAALNQYIYGETQK